MGPGSLTIVVAISLANIPQIARIVYSATLEIRDRGYVRAAIARGEGIIYVLTREILPSISPTVAADVGPRITVAILLVAGLNFLGVGLQPPLADWGVMISENRPGMQLQPWAIAIPAILIAVLTIAVNLVADSVARASGRSIDESLRHR